MFDFSRMSRIAATAAIACVTAIPSARGDGYAEPQDGNAARGATIYQTCMSCHSIDEDDVGPRHRGVVGRRAGSIAGFGYSPALRNSELIWDRATLDRWLANPQALVPGSRMFFAMPSARDRADVIAYLSTQG